MLNAKKGISAKQLQRDLGIGGYKTAWYLNHRIREAMGIGDIPKLGGTVEIDETYVGGKVSGKGQRYAKSKSKWSWARSNAAESSLTACHCRECRHLPRIHYRERERRC